LDNEGKLILPGLLLGKRKNNYIKNASHEWEAFLIAMGKFKI